MTPPRTFTIQTFGCQMNVYDSERMGEALVAAGYEAVALDSGGAADLTILNTCHIREKAAEKVYSEIGRLKKHGARMIAVAGCVAQAEGAEIMARAPVDIVVGPQAYHRLPELVARAAHKPVDTDMPIVPKFDALPPRARPRGPSAHLTVQEGCDKFCAFCVVPYTRGAEASRPAAAILAEATVLLAGGARELTLLGQNVNAYRDADGVGLAALIRQLARLPGLARIRYTTSHPRDMDDDLIAAHVEVPALMPFLHLPVQSGSDAVLKRMNRQHSAAEYLRLIERVRRARPDIALSGDFIVGFPGETDADFEATLALVRETNYTQAYSFKYSPRPGTPAARAADPVPEPVMVERLARLQELLFAQQHAFNRASEGHTLDVLFDRPGRLPGQLIGKTPHLQSVHVIAPGLKLGDLAPVHIQSAGPRSLEGTLVPMAKAA